MPIIPGSKYGDPRKQASMDMPHGLTPQTIESLGDRMEQFLPGLAGQQGKASEQFFDGLLPEGAELDPRVAARNRKQANIPLGVTSNQFGGGAFNSGVNMTLQRPYQPEFETLVEDTRVLMADGTYKQIKDIQIGDKLIDKSGFIQKVIKTRHMGIPDELVEIKAWGGKKLYATDWHKWPVWAWVHKCLCGCGKDVKPGRCFVQNHYRASDIPSGFKVVDGGAKPYRQRRIPNSYEPFQKLRSDEIKKGDFLVIPRKFDVIKPDITLGQARLLGYYIAEGSTSDNSMELTFGINEVDTWVKNASDILDTLGVETTLSCDNKRNVARLRSKHGSSKENNSLLIYWLIQNGGKGCYKKRLAGDVLRWPIKYKIELLRGMFRGDGSQVYAESIKNGYSGKQFQVTYYTASHNLADQLQIILAQLGIPARIQYIKPGIGTSKDGKKFNRNEGWRLVISNESSRRLADLIWDKDIKYEPRKWNIRESCLIDDDYIYVPVSSVKFVKNKERKAVINITVTGDKSYLVENIGTYNSPDRQQYPVHRILANRYWRLFYKLDPVIGNCIDMYRTMPWSDFQLTGEGITGEIKEKYEDMCEAVNLLRILEYMVSEFMIIGECVPHCFFDDVKGIWSYIALHNPDQLEVIDTPFIKMDPIVEFIPDDRLRAVLTSNNHLLKRVREQMPQELIARLVARQNIPLSPINMTFIPRRLHPYDTRGTSIISRMWRILMYEDSQPPGTPITRPDGTNTPIEQLVIGDAIIGKDGDIQEITHISEKHSEKLISIKVQGGWEVKCTASHKWPVFKKNDINNLVDPLHIPPISTKTLASDIKVGDYLSIPRRFKQSELDDRSNSASARLLGYYVSEGSRATFASGNYGVAWSLNVNEKDTWGTDIQNLCNEIGCDTKIYTHKSGCMVRSHKVDQKWLADWLFNNGGEHADCKRLSSMVMGWPLEFKKEFIRGYFRGDGSCNALHNNQTKVTKRRSNQKSVRAATISKTLAYQIQLVLAQLGVFAKIRPYQPPNNDGRNRRQIYYLEIFSHSADKLANMVWGDITPERVIKDDRSKSNIVITDTHILVPITKVSVEEYSGLVYSLETSGDHSYLNANVATYNSIYNASIATARRHAGPLKVAKLGNPQTGWIPSQEHEQRLLRLLATAELDVNAWLVYHYGINFELVGTTDRIMNINQHHDVIERIKLIALGISKAFLHGEVTYASSITGLSVFLQRMQSVRNFFMNTWIIPKFFKPIAKINGWVRRDKKELNFRYRIKRSEKEIDEEGRWILPTMEWSKQLDHNINTELIGAITSLEGLGVKFSKSTKYAAAGRKFEEELQKLKDEREYEKQLSQYLPAEALAGGPGKPAGGAPMPPPKPPGAPPAGAPPASPLGPGGAPGSATKPGMGTPPAAPPGMPSGGAAPLPPGATADKEGDGGGTGPSGKADPATRNLDSTIWDHKGRYGNWSASEVNELVKLIKEGNTDSPLWGDLDSPRFRSVINGGDPFETLDVLEEFLEDQGYPSADIRQLRKILDTEGILKDIATGDVAVLADLESKLDVEGLNDKDMENRVSSYIDGDRPDVVRLGNDDTLLVGHGNENWSGDVSGLVGDE
jgi:intein/homing endonuclease